MTGPVSPCKECTSETGRHPGCHPTCKSYLEYKVQHEEAKEKIRKEKAKLAVFDSYAAARSVKIKKSK